MKDFLQRIFHANSIYSALVLLSGLSEFFNASHDGPYSKIVSPWKRAGQSILYTMVIPPNSTATVSLSVKREQKAYLNGKVILNPPNIKAGTYQFIIK